jgi:mannosylfructose-6-phosphate phosphatase
VERGSILVSDVDYTLLGDDAALARFARWIAARRPDWRVVYASGRFVASLLESVAATDLPEPDALIGGVGTEICLMPGSKPLPAWQEQLREGWDASAVRRALARFSDLTLQPAEFLSPLKVSYYAIDADRGLLAQVGAALAAAGVRAKVIYSSCRDLDVLPAAADKGAAAAFLCRYWGNESCRVIVSGDSGNDAPLFRPEFRGIVVANAHNELKALAGPRVYLAARPYAAGVVEGLEHWLAADATLLAATREA